MDERPSRASHRNPRLNRKRRHQVFMEHFYRSMIWRLFFHRSRGKARACGTFAVVRLQHSQTVRG